MYMKTGGSILYSRTSHEKSGDLADMSLQLHTHHLWTIPLTVFGRPTDAQIKIENLLPVTTIYGYDRGKGLNLAWFSCPCQQCLSGFFCDSKLIVC